MPETVFGVPTHAIVIHATVVLVPLAALVVLLHAFWPAARRRLGVVTPLVAGVALVLVPLSTDSGENLERQVGHSALVERHAQLADGMLPWAIGLFVVAAGLWLLDRRRARPGSAGGPRWLPVVAGGAGGRRRRRDRAAGGPGRPRRRRGCVARRRPERVVHQPAGGTSGGLTADRGWPPSGTIGAHDLQRHSPSAWTG